MRFKELMEKRAKKQERMKEIVNKANQEVRALSEEESKEFDKLEEEIRAIDESIERMKKAEKLVKDEEPEPAPQNKDGKKDKEEQRAEEEENAFADYIRGVVDEKRADVNLTMTNNGAVIPTTIANKIIEEVVDMCPIYSMADRYNVGGTLSIPYYDESEGKIEMKYSDEFKELESTSGSFASIDLKGFLAGVLTKVSKQLINNSNFNIVDFVVIRMAKSIALWIEKELLNGTDDKIEGLSKCSNVINAAAETVLTSDELIDVQEAVPDVYQAEAIWIMNKKTRTAIRKLKDQDGNYILNKDATAKWGYTLFGKDVYASDNMPEMAAGKNAIYYGDMSGLAVKVAEDVTIEVLRERYATQHAVGVVGWIEIDAKIENKQKIAALKMKQTA